MRQAERLMKIEIYSDVVCPWCYIGERRLSRALAAFPQRDQVEIVFRPYQLDPGAPDAAVPLTQYIERRFGRRGQGMLAQVSAAAAGEGITIAWEKALSVNTRTAHRLLRFARQQYGAAVQRAVAERLFDLHFTQGGDIADIGQLAETSELAGLDAGRVRAHLESDEGLQELEAEFDSAQRLGITAVPTFVVDGRYVIQGAQPEAQFLQVLQQAAKTMRAGDAAAR
jgi:predicted DsbA family dithiol-disulfide isomerase